MTAAQQRPSGVQVWHLIGEQGSGKSTYVRYFAEALRESTNLQAIEIEAWGIADYHHRVDLALQALGRADVLMLTHCDLPAGAVPPYWIPGDRIIGFPRWGDHAELEAQARLDAVAFASQRRGPAAAPIGRWAAITTWLREKLWIWLAALALTVIVGHEAVLIDDGAEVMAADLQAAPAEAQQTALAEEAP